MEVRIRYCSNCGKELQDDMQFCPSCGASVQATVRTPMVPEPAFTDERPTKKSHQGIVEVIILLAILAGAGFLYSNAAKVKTYNQLTELYNRSMKES